MALRAHWPGVILALPLPRTLHDVSGAKLCIAAERSALQHVLINAVDILMAAESMRISA